MDDDDIDLQRWRRIEELFNAAIDRSGEARERCLTEACGGDLDLRREVEELLAAEGLEQDLLSGLVRQEASQWVASHEELKIGDRLGPWSLEERIGVGGMSMVYRASRDDAQFRKQVALKVLKRGMDTEDILRRFSNERHILAQLEHPNIARLLDAGSTDDGRPFFAMELVQGLPIDAYCDGRRLAIDARLQLFTEVCDAVSYAHRRLIVHRDLKPSNILVTDEGVPKLLDFGIAKLLDPAVLPWASEATEAGLRVLTPGYASPEQILGQPVTTVSDVYSLGVLLFQLLCGRRPYRLTAVTPRAVEQAIREQTPSRPSVAVRQVMEASPVDLERSRPASPEGIAAMRRLTEVALVRRLRGDLDAVVLKALRKEPGQRYLSVADLAADIGRHRRFQPVLAHRGSWRYRSGRFLRRHRTAVLLVVVSSVLLLTLMTNLVVLNLKLSRERGASERRRQVAEEVKEFMIDLFPASASGVEGAQLTVEELLARGVAAAHGEGHSGPVRAALLDTVGRAYQRLGLYDQAAPLLEESLALHLRTDEGDSAELADALNRLAIMRSQQGLYDQAEPLFRKTLEVRQRLYGPRHALVAASLNNLALLLHDRGEYQQAEPLYRQATALDASLLGEDHLSTLGDKANLALLLNDLGKYDEAKDLLHQVLAGRRAQLGEEHEDVAQTLVVLAKVLMVERLWDEAEAHLRTSLQIVGRQLGEGHPEAARVLASLGELYRQRGDLEQAKTLHERALAIRRQRLGDEHPEVASSLADLAAVASDEAHWQEAEASFRRALALQRRALRPDHPNIAASLIGLGVVLLNEGHPSSAEPLLREAVAIHQRHLPPEHAERQRAERLLAEAVRRRRSP